MPITTTSNNNSDHISAGFRCRFPAILFLFLETNVTSYIKYNLVTATKKTSEPVLNAHETRTYQSVRIKASNLVICDWAMFRRNSRGNTRLFAYKTFCKYLIRIYSYLLYKRESSRRKWRVAVGCDGRRLILKPLTV